MNAIRGGVIQKNITYTGGAHPNAYRSADNFDTKTGEWLRFEDIVTDEEAARKFVEESILKQLETASYKEYLFDDYKESVSQILQNDTWYLTVGRRITIGCNSKLNSRPTPIRPRGLASNCTLLSA